MNQRATSLSHIFINDSFRLSFCVISLYTDVRDKKLIMSKLHFNDMINIFIGIFFSENNN